MRGADIVGLLRWSGDVRYYGVAYEDALIFDRPCGVRAACIDADGRHTIRSIRRTATVWRSRDCSRLTTSEIRWSCSSAIRSRLAARFNLWL